MANILFTSVSQHPLDLPYKLYGLGMNHIQEPINRPQGMPLYQWIQCVSGRGSLILNGQKYTLMPGQGIFIHPNVAHAYQAQNPGEAWMVHFLCFSGQGVETLIHQTLLESSGVFSLNTPDMIIAFMEELYRMPPGPPLFTCASHSATLYHLLLNLLMDASAQGGVPLSSRTNKIAPIMAYIEDHYQEPIYLDDIAAVCGRSKEYLCQLFKKAAGLSIFEHIQQTRIKHSKEMLLAMPGVPAHVIGSQCGFNSSSYFNKIFKKIEGISPGEFRSQNGIRPF